jgi:hypothetical protein
LLHEIQHPASVPVLWGTELGQPRVSGQRAHMVDGADATDNSTNGVSATTAWKLGKQTRVFGNLSFSKWSQNATLQPYTINTVLPVYPLERTTADISANVSPSGG